MTMPTTTSDKRTIIEEGSELKGTLTSSCGVVVRGRLDGEIETPALTVSATGAVHGRAKVGQVESEGELSGEFDADVVRLAGTVKDNTVIRTKSLEVKLDAGGGKMQVMFGECELAVGEEPADENRTPPDAIGKPAPEGREHELNRREGGEEEPELHLAGAVGLRVDREQRDHDAEPEEVDQHRQEHHQELADSGLLGRLALHAARDPTSTRGAGA